MDPELEQDSEGIETIDVGPRYLFVINLHGKLLSYDTIDSIGDSKCLYLDSKDYNLNCECLEDLNLNVCKSKLAEKGRELKKGEFLIHDCDKCLRSYYLRRLY